MCAFDARESCMGLLSGNWKSETGEKGSSAFHSTSYHKYFDGYTEMKVLKSNGKGDKIVRVYTGPYFSQDVTDRQWKRNKLILIMVYMIVVTAFLFFAALDKANNKVWFTELPQAIVLCSFLWMLYAVFHYVAAPRKMTINQYRSSSGRLLHSGRAAMTASWAAAVTQLVYACVPGNADKLCSILCAVIFALGGAAICYLIVHEGRMIYRHHLSEEQEGTKGMEIKW